MAADNVFLITKGSSFYVQFNWKQGDGSNANLTGYTIALYEAEDCDGLEVELTTPSTGLITLSMSAEDVAALDNRTLPNFRIQITSSGGQAYASNRLELRLK